MQYLLSHAEFEGLVSKSRLQQMTDRLQEASKMLAVNAGGCLITHTRIYCDDCPAARLCPHPSKAWSK